jgi:DHA3 family macrolide efflux protein-like MFS transporter
MFVFGIVMLFLVGTMNPIVNGPLMALVQSIVAPEMQGRVFGLVASSVSIMAPLGLAIAGPLSDTVGVRVWFVVGGAATAAIGIGGFLIPAVYHIEDEQDETESLETMPVNVCKIKPAEDAAESLST